VTYTVDGLFKVGMLAEYYEKRGWKNGVVPEEKLKELEIIA
jgi:aldehyde:ferredoxin oxidoreductase